MQRTAMHERAKELISELSLQPHPEGGLFREIFRSAHKVQPLDERLEIRAFRVDDDLLLARQGPVWPLASARAGTFAQLLKLAETKTKDLR